MFTYGGADGDAFSLEAPSKANVQKARIRGHEMVLRSAASIKNILTQGDDKGSFKRHLAFLTANMMKSMYHRLEIQLMYGQAGLGIIDSVSSPSIVIEQYEWAPAIWNGSEGSVIEIYDSTGVTNRGSATIVSVNQETFTVTLNALPGGTVATDVVYWKGAKSTEFLGLHAIATTSGSLFGIDNSVYNLFKSNIQNVGTDATTNAAVLSFEDVQRGVAKAMTKGLGEDEMTVIVNPKTWANLLTEQAALKSYDSSYSKTQVETGSQTIKFYSQNGLLKIVASNFCKEGYAYAICEKDMMRVGASEVSFKDPVTGEDKYFRHLEGHHGVEMRAYTDQALFCSAPAKIVLFRYIKSE